MQPSYVTLSSTGSSPWKPVNSQIAPQEISFSVIGTTGGSSYAISVTLEDPTATYPSPVSSAPTAFTLFTGSSVALFSIVSSATVPLLGPIYAYQVTLNSQSSVGAKITAVVLQDGIG
jgi:hypothetical protein